MLYNWMCPHIWTKHFKKYISCRLLEHGKNLKSYSKSKFPHSCKKKKAVWIQSDYTVTQSTSCLHGDDMNNVTRIESLNSIQPIINVSNKIFTILSRHASQTCWHFQRITQNKQEFQGKLCKSRQSWLFPVCKVGSGKRWFYVLRHSSPWLNPLWPASIVHCREDTQTRPGQRQLVKHCIYTQTPQQLQALQRGRHNNWQGHQRCQLKTLNRVSNSSN